MTSHPKANKLAPDEKRRRIVVPKPALGAPGQVSFTIDQFCGRNAISRPFFYKLKAQGRGPKVNDINRITQEAEAEWLREREAAAERTP